MKKLFYLLFISSVVLASCNKYERELDGVWVKPISSTSLSKWEFNESNKSFSYTHWVLVTDNGGIPTGDTTFKIINGNFDVRRRKFIYLKDMTSNLPAGTSIYTPSNNIGTYIPPSCVNAFENDTVLSFDFNSDSILLPQPPIIVGFGLAKEPLISWFHKQ